MSWWVSSQNARYDLAWKCRKNINTWEEKSFWKEIPYSVDSGRKMSNSVLVGYVSHFCFPQQLESAYRSASLFTNKGPRAGNSQGAPGLSQTKWIRAILCTLLLYHKRTQGSPSLPMEIACEPRKLEWRETMAPCTFVVLLPPAIYQEIVSTLRISAMFKPPALLNSSLLQTRECSLSGAICL